MSASHLSAVLVSARLSDLPANQGRTATPFTFHPIYFIYLKTIIIVYTSIIMIRKSFYSGMRYFCKSLTGGCEIFFGSRKHSENANSSRSGQDFKSPG